MSQPESGSGACRATLLGLDPGKIAENRHRAEEEADAKDIPPLSRERIKEFSAFSDELSDEEFEEYMAFIDAERGRTS